jgi:hypothetical protein
LFPYQIGRFLSKRNAANTHLRPKKRYFGRGKPVTGAFPELIGHSFVEPSLWLRRRFRKLTFACSFEQIVQRPQHRKMQPSFRLGGVD